MIIVIIEFMRVKKWRQSYLKINIVVKIIANIKILDN